jgi:hypothetical protein
LNPRILDPMARTQPPENWGWLQPSKSSPRASHFYIELHWCL